MITIFSKKFNLTTILGVFILICASLAIVLNIIYYIQYDKNIINKQMLLNVILVIYAVVLLCRNLKSSS